MKHIFKSSTFTFLLIALAGLTTITSCSKHSDYDFTGTATANVRLVNTSTDAGPSKLYLNDVLRTTNAVSYGTASGYSQTYIADNTIAVQSASGTMLASSSASLDADGNYTYFLTGASGNYAILTSYDNTTTPTAGKAKVRFVQAASGLASANLLGNGVSLFAAQSFKAVTNYMEVTAGTFVFTVTSPGSEITLASSTSTTLQAGKSYIIYTSGISGATGTNALTVNVLSTNQ
ncbi:DUF4397 domain-containing protein [Mucilaginibacter boryungensis]|uniref:DUF4397 domain-containing protein n=1 Tax=Mucilaginibacter boryungensis TaxID=768480 RepID=A0ABR9XC44_9SPHI|nr:DUF4397 domain-containing protein [Mucilaginibacter boryungensis]MBE9664947.1 DUF4397 domain-containing protein [Mucilaginibacter boryungensis]